MIQKLKLINFRNADEINLNLNSHINIFYGENGQGKTNIVEGLAFLSLLKSFRNCDYKSLIQNGKDFATIIGSDLKNNEYKVVLSENRKKLFVNSKEIRRHSDFIGLINVVSFTPEDCFLFKLSPKDRREYINDEISKLSPAYNQFVTDYDKIRMDRNELLKSELEVDDLLDTFSKRLAIYAVKIVAKRDQFINGIKDNFTKYYSKISGTSDIARIEYETNFLNKTENEIYEMIKNNSVEDKGRKQTCVGPHKDDFKVYLNDRLIDEFGSQGQNRIAVIALKLAILKLVKEELNDDAIVILDDVLSELDSTRKNNLLNELIDKNQLLITCTNDIKIEQNVAKFEIIDGKIGGNV